MELFTFWQLCFQSVALVDLWVRSRRFQHAMDFVFCDAELEVVHNQQICQNEAPQFTNRPHKGADVRKPHLKTKLRKQKAVVRTQRKTLLSWHSFEEHTCGAPSIEHIGRLEEADLQLHQEIGCGAFGTVRQGIFRGREAAVKMVQRIPEDRTAPKEVEILSYLATVENPFILNLLAVFFHEANLLMITELISGRDLETWLFNEVPDDIYFEELCFFAARIIRAMTFLHSHHIGHFDLKGTNFMVDQSRALKVIDFGMSDVVRAPLSIPRTSTAHYLAPEVMRINRKIGGAPGYGLAADVWSFGVCLYYWYAGEMPFADDEGLPCDIYNVVLYDFTGLPTYKGFEEDEWKALIPSLLYREPEDRPTFQFLAGSSFLR